MKRPLQISSQPVPQLGLVCITHSDRVRFRTVTRKRLLSLGEAEQQDVLRSLYAANVQRLSEAIAFCDDHDIRLYRLIDKLFPFADSDLGHNLLTEFAAQLRAIGDRATALGIRLVQHPSQYVVLNSDNPTVIANSIQILSTHARVMDLMGLPQSAWSALNIHGGKGDRAERLVDTIQTLPPAVRSRLTLENDEYTYSAAQIVEICQATGVAMVFDARHHLIHEKLSSYDQPSVAAMVAAARTTWAFPEWQLVHISNGREALHDPSHSDLITTMPESFQTVPWIEVEAKHKEEAIAHLRQTWPPLQPHRQAVLS